MKIGFIGCGNMGGALALAASKSKDAEIFLFDKDEAKAKLLSAKIGNATITDAKSIASECALIFLGVKPNVIPDAIFEINKELEKRGIDFLGIDRE